MMPVAAATLRITPLFADGKLRAATKRAWTSGQGEVELTGRLFTLIYDNSGKSTIEERPGAELTWTRDSAAILETQESSLGRLKEQTLKILLGGKLFTLSLTTSPGDSHVTLDEVIVQAPSTAPAQSGRRNSTE
jgi:hypothetical protein